MLQSKKSLTQVHLRCNGIVMVPLHTSSELLSVLVLQNNPLRFPPYKVIEERSLVQFFKALSKGATALRTVKVMMVGHGGAGKSTLIQALLAPLKPNTLKEMQEKTRKCYSCCQILSRRVYLLF